MFEKHIDVALSLNKPLIVHSRQAEHDIIKILKEKNAKSVGGIMHCFTGSIDFALEVIALNFYISFSGIITFKNANEIKNVAFNLPMDKILIETDAPYLSPVPYRGKSNEPSFIVYTADMLGKIKGLSVDKVGEITSNNFFNLFNF
jgi:TatD DNase family protein